MNPDKEEIYTSVPSSMQGCAGMAVASATLDWRVQHIVVLVLIESVSNSCGDSIVYQWFSSSCASVQLVG